MNRLIALLVLVLGTSLVAAPDARAEIPPQAHALCSGSPPLGCSIETGDAIREGITAPVVVRGNPHTRVQVVVYQAIAPAGELTGLVPINEPVEVLTSRQGVATAHVRLPAVIDQPSSGWGLVSVGGVELSDLPMTVGTFVPLGARIPTILGDGFDEAKPVGHTMELHYTGAIPGTRFAVEYRDDAGLWHEIHDTTTGGAPAANQVGTITYQLPRGLTDTPKQVRLRNLSDNAVTPLWFARPAVDGNPHDRNPVFTPPPVGDALDGTRPLEAHPEHLTRGVSLALGIGSAGLVVVALASGRRDRR